MHLVIDLKHFLRGQKLSQPFATIRYQPKLACASSGVSVCLATTALYETPTNEGIMDTKHVLHGFLKHSNQVKVRHDLVRDAANRGQDK